MKNSEVYETLADIIAVVSILIKFGCDEILDNHTLFISFLNELGFKLNGYKITAINLHEMTQDITNRQKESILSEFMKGHEPLYRRLSMVDNFGF